MNRQKLLLFLLLIILSVSIVYSYLRSPKQQEAALPAQPGTRSAAAKKGSGAPPDVSGDTSMLHLELLEQEQPRSRGYRRNIFSPIFRDELKQPPFKPLPPPPRPMPLPMPPPPAPAPAPVQPPPPAPTAEELARQAADAELAKFVFLGFLQKNGQKTVFLSKNGEIFLAKKGTVLANVFRVTDLTDDAITIRSDAGSREIVIPLVEMRALSTRRAQP